MYRSPPPVCVVPDLSERLAAPHASLCGTRRAQGPWTAEEDARVTELVELHGCKKWSFIASKLTGR